MTMTKTLVAYFSASGQTAKLAKTFADAEHADLFEIEPEKGYTSADLDWNDKKSRSSIEMNDPSSRPGILSRVADMDAYETVFVGFPIWWYEAPRIIQTFLEEYDFAGKKMVAFATSGGSGMGSSVSILEKSTPGATWIGGKKFSAHASESEVSSWIESIK